LANLRDPDAECGFDRTYISRVERGIIIPTISRLWKIADALDTPLSQIVKRMKAGLPKAVDAVDSGESFKGRLAPELP